jgi:hypothetical protein
MVEVYQMVLQMEQQIMEMIHLLQHLNLLELHQQAVVVEL